MIVRKFKLTAWHSGCSIKQSLHFCLLKSTEATKSMTLWYFIAFTAIKISNKEWKFKQRFRNLIYVYLNSSTGKGWQCRPAEKVAAGEEAIPISKRIQDAWWTCNQMLKRKQIFKNLHLLVTMKIQWILVKYGTRLKIELYYISDLRLVESRKQSGLMTVSH